MSTLVEGRTRGRGLNNKQMSKFKYKGVAEEEEMTIASRIEGYDQFIILRRTEDEDRKTPRRRMWKQATVLLLLLIKIGEYLYAQAPY